MSFVFNKSLNGYEVFVQYIGSFMRVFKVVNR